MYTVTVSRVDFGHHTASARTMRGAYYAALRAAPPAFLAGYFTHLDDLFASARKLIAFRRNCPRVCAGDEAKRFHVEIAR